MKQTITYQRVNTAGEISAIVLSPVLNTAMPTVATIIMRQNKTIEQVGFLNPKNQSFRMMGGELSVNGMLAAEYIKTGATSITLPRSIIRSIMKNTITFRGMTYVLLQSMPPTAVITNKQISQLRSLTSDNPASGLIYYEQSSIKPLIYVKETKTYIWEQSCGSGSIAYALYSGKETVTQPSGKKVYIKFTDKTITYQTEIYTCSKETVLIGSKEVL